MQTELRSNLKSETFWVRTLFMIIFFIVFRFLDLLVIVVTLAQWLFMLFSGTPNTYLRQFSASLAQFSKQIIDYLGCCSSNKPFPFQDWPASQTLDPCEPKDTSDTDGKSELSPSEPR